MVTIAESTVLVTGGNRGIGLALVEEALSRRFRQTYGITPRQWQEMAPAASPRGSATALSGEEKPSGPTG